MPNTVSHYITYADLFFNLPLMWIRIYQDFYHKLSRAPFLFCFCLFFFFFFFFFFFSFCCLSPCVKFLETYIPNPLRCHNCQKFGHHKEKCTRPPICKNCGETGNHIHYQQPQNVQTANKIIQHIQKNVNYGEKKKRILEVKHTKNISCPEARKFIENSLATTTYGNIVKSTNSTQNQGMTPHFHITNLIKELNTLLELLREILTNLTTNLHAGPDPKKNL